eukprot:193538-Chlamydomonas_euryale.AAC.1
MREKVHAVVAVGPHVAQQRRHQRGVPCLVQVVGAQHMLRLAQMHVGRKVGHHVHGVALLLHRDMPRVEEGGA